MLPRFGLLCVALVSIACSEGPRLSSLVERLGDDDVAVREKAAEVLLAAGDAALPDLSTAARHRDPEIAARARELIEKLELYRWSLIYEGYDSENHRAVIYESRLDGSDEKVLTDGRMPSLSGDQRYLACYKGYAAGGARIRDLDSGTERPVPSYDLWSQPPVWSEDGTYLAWLTRQPTKRNDKFLILNRLTGEILALATSESDPQEIGGWLPDGSGVWTLNSGRHPWISTLTGKVTKPESEAEFARSITKRNDAGSWAWFESYPDFFTSDLWIRNESNGQERCVLQRRGRQSVTLWSRGGRMLLLSTAVGAEADNLAEMDPATGEVRPIISWETARSLVHVEVAGELPYAVLEWTPRKRGFHTGPPDEVHLSLLNLDTGEEREIRGGDFSEYTFCLRRRK
jgi:hypothetical protein